MSRPLKTLAMDSAAQVGGVALLAGSRLLAQTHFQGAEGHAILLPTSVQHLLTQQDSPCATLELLVVTHGPGSFSGLRIALGYAKGIALAHGTPLVGISTLDLLAAGAGPRPGWLSVVVDARRGEIFAALFRMENGIPSPYHAPGHALTPEQWATTLANTPELQEEPLCLTGTGLTLYAELFRKWLPIPFATTAESNWVTDPFLLGLLGQKLFFHQQAMAASTQDTGAPFRPEVTQLDYQRRPDAEIKKRDIPCTSVQ